jgi:methionine biosynthesis protein MetW
VIQHKDYYERYWSTRDTRPDGSVGPELRQLLQRTVSSTSTVLDVGCGDGRTCGLWLKDRAAEYVGVDISELAISEARAAGLDARRIDDATALPFADGQFDVVVCVEVLEHVFLPHRVAGEIQRVLRPGGVLLVTVPNVTYWRRRLELVVGRWNPFGDGLSTTQPWRDPHIRFFTRGSLENMLLSSGFTDVKVGGYRGSLFRDVPYVARLFRSPRGSTRLYQLFQRLAPSFFALHLHAVGVKNLN